MFTFIVFFLLRSCHKNLNATQRKYFYFLQPYFSIPQISFTIVQFLGIYPTKLDWFAHNHTITSICLTKNSETLITGGKDHYIKFWDLTNGKLINQFYDSSLAYQLVLSKNENYLLSRSNPDNCMIKIFDLRSNKLMRRIFYDSSVYCGCITPDEKYCVASCFDGTIYFHDIETGNCVSNFICHFYFFVILLATVNSPNDMRCRRLAHVPNIQKKSQIGYFYEKILCCILF